MVNCFDTSRIAAATIIFWLGRIIFQMHINIAEKFISFKQFFSLVGKLWQNLQSDKVGPGAAVVNQKQSTLPVEHCCQIINI